jgi:hypothetical protein
MLAYIEIKHDHIDVPQDGEALTIADAAAALGVKPQRVSQLLRDGRLSGPPGPAPGRQPAGLLRVYVSSLRAYRAAVPAGRRGPSPAPPTSADVSKRLAYAEGQLADSAAELRALRELVERVGEREHAAMSALLDMKVAADVSREKVAVERRRVAELGKLLQQTAAVLVDRLQDDPDAVTDAYSNALTQLISQPAFGQAG